MGDQDGIILNSLVYEKVTKAIADIEDKYERPGEEWSFEVDDCRVVWESENHAHLSTSYVIEDFGAELGESTLFIRGQGGSGGRYEIIPKPNNEPWIRYHPPNRSTGWEEPLERLMIVTPDFEYVKEEGWVGFFSDVYQIVEELKRHRE